MDVVTLGAALNGAKSQTEDYVSGHFKEGTACFDVRLLRRQSI